MGSSAAAGRAVLRVAACGVAAFLLACPVGARAPEPGGAPRMRAAVYREYGSPDVVRIEELDKPVPGEDQILVRIRAASVNPLDWHFVEGTPYLARLVAFGLLRPKVTRLGVDYAGTVESVGGKVTRFKPGDEVFGSRTGAFADYVCVLADRAVALKPPNVSFEQAASVPVAAVTALQALRDQGKVRPGQAVLINGASGGVGTFAVQIAKSLGATVTGVCSTKNVEMVRSIGADRVVDYTRDDFTRGGERYDLILDNVGNRSLSEIRRVLKPAGRYVLIGGGGIDDTRWTGPLVRLIKTLAMAPFIGQRMGMMLAEMNEKDLTVLGDLMRAGKVTPVIDRRYDLGEISEAIRYVERGHARGKVVVMVEPRGDAPPAGAAPPAASRTTTGPYAVAATILGVLIGVPVVPLVAALLLDRGIRRRHPARRPFRWGYYFGILSIVGGLALGAVLESGPVAVIACGALYGSLAWLFARRRHAAWIALTILSFNPIVWVVNFFYLRKRWAEDSSAAPAAAAGG